MNIRSSQISFVQIFMLFMVSFTARPAYNQFSSTTGAKTLLKSGKDSNLMLYLFTVDLSLSKVLLCMRINFIKIFYLY